MDQPSTPCAPEGAQAIASIAPQSFQWLWPRWVARGVLTLLDGDPDLGKSTLAVELAAHVSQGTLISVPPAPAEVRPPQNVLLLSAEDDPARAIRPRALAAGADLERLFLLPHLPGHPEEPIQLPTHVPALREVIDRHQVALVVVDPLMAYLSRSVSASSDQDVRRALHPLKVLAEQTQCAILIIRHFNKKGSLPALYRGGGSIGILGACRIGLIVAQDPANEEGRVLVMNKCNLAKKPPSLRFHHELRGDANALVWDGECSWTAEDVVTKLSEEKAEQLSRVDECMVYIRELLRKGKMPARDLEIWCLGAGYAERTVHRARKKLGVKASKAGIFGWMVELPAEPRGPT